MPPTVSQVEQNSKYNRTSRSRKFDEIEEETAETNDLVANTGDLTMSDLCSMQVVKRKRASIEDNNDSQCEEESSQTTTTVEVDKENNNPQINQDEIVEENVEKKQKTEGKKEKKRYGLRKSKNTSLSQSVNRCNYCRQDLEEIHFYPGHPNNAEEEAVALISFTMDKDEQDVEFEREEDRRPQIKLTNFSVYDENGHLCPFDTGLIEKNVLLYVSGYMKFIWEEDSSPEGGVPAKEMGPIVAWYTTGYDGGELALIIFATQYAEYYLMEPSEAYAPFMNAVKEKIYMSKLVIEFLLAEISPTYEDLVNKIQTTVPPKNMKQFTEETLLRHAQFICDQVLSFDDAADSDDDLFITTPCMRSLANLAGIILGRGKFVRMTHQQRHQRRLRKEIKKQTWSKATTTKLVSDMFENMFADQIAEHDTTSGPRRQRCGVCENCLQPDCGECSNCRDMKKFGGRGTGKQACKKRRCPNMAIQEADDSDPENLEYEDMNEEEAEPKVKRDFKENSCRNHVVVWENKEDKIVDGRRTYYKSVMVGNEKIEVNDYILVESSSPTNPFHIYKIMFMWENENGTKQLHGNWFYRSDLTVLGETADPKELFLSDCCDDIPVSCIKSKANVVHKKMPENWFELGNTDVEHEIKNADDKFFYKMKYIPETCRFVDPPPDIECPKDRKENIHRFCPVCHQNTITEHLEIPKVYELIEQRSKKEVIYGVVKYRGEEYRVGNAVFIHPSAFKYNRVRKFHTPVLNPKNEVDEEMYPEFYRKNSDLKRGDQKRGVYIPEPFHIGYINTIYATTTSRLVVASDIYIKINKMYRPENTHRDSDLIHQTDLNMVYWSDDICSVPFSSVAGKCYLAYSENLNESIEEWSSAGPNRFYFSEAFNFKENKFEDPPYNVVNIFKTSKGRGKNKLKAKNVKPTENKPVLNKPVDYPTVKRQLRTFDIFAGCGGLSEGLKQAGVAESLWAVEYMEPMANAYRLNNPKAIVFTDDCNTLLLKVINGESTNEKGQKLPQKGEVEFMCGGPPCQGFSGLNRFNRRQYSLFKNSLIVTYLSFCDYYRPKFFLMENVRNFVSYKKGMVLKLTMRCLIQMGYQCTFGVLQAGNYGVSQTRNRMILLAAAPGEILPNYPEPTNVFNISKYSCTFVDNKKYVTNCVWKTSAPYRMITVKDSMCDLPEIKCGNAKEEMSYLSEPQTHFQRKMRNRQDSVLTDHICKEATPLMEARMKYIPTAPGSDWRDLPNIKVQLSDGTYTKKMEYLYHDKKAGKSSTGALRGVCRCSTGASCDPTDKQFNTLIPWCLPHTGNRNGQWAGLYGRLEWDGYFGTTITNPEPLGKQGRVLHPSQNRLISVRECARSQGFPDSFRFYGTIIDKHRQIGNAVPPPLGAAIGYEIKKCISNKTLSSDTALVESHAETAISSNVDNNNEAVEKSATTDRIEDNPDEKASTSSMNFT